MKGSTAISSIRGPELLPFSILDTFGREVSRMEREVKECSHFESGLVRGLSGCTYFRVLISISGLV